MTIGFPDLECKPRASAEHVECLRRLPVFAAGASQRGPSKDAPEAINVCLAIDDTATEPGTLDGARVGETPGRRSCNMI